MRAPPTPDGHGLRHDTLVRIRRFRAPRRRQSFRTYRSLSLSLPPPHACERFHRQARLLQVQYRTRTFTKCRRRSAPAGAGLKKRCVLRGSRTCRPVSPPYSRIERPRTRGRPSRGGLKRMPMSGGMGKRNHEDVSDTMALVQAACKVLAITARPFAHFRHRVGMRGSVRSRE